MGSEAEDIQELSFDQFMKLSREKRHRLRNGLPKPIHELEEEIIQLSKNIETFIDNFNSTKNQEQ